MADRFLCAPGLRLEAQERMTEIQFAQTEAALAKIEQTIDRVERRLWVVAYGVAAVVLVEAVTSLLKLAP